MIGRDESTEGAILVDENNGLARVIVLRDRL